MLGSSKRVLALVAALLLVLTPILALPVQTGPDPSQKNALSLRDGSLSPGTSTSVSHRSVDSSMEQLETRQGPLSIVTTVVSGIMKLVDLIKGLIARVRARRAKTNAEKACIKDVVDEIRKEHSNWNVLAIHVDKYTPHFTGTLGKDYSKVTHKCDLPDKSEADYDVYTGPNLHGTVDNNGGKKSQDVAWGGIVKSDHHGKLITIG
ncbi:hypothetical protein H0H92_005370 [Tricholoma furcatifolium]|nr:hypothetical protein H0H92_005370 [Tricholoma furcatifolium]